jgi:hypothetical protein
MAASPIPTSKLNFFHGLLLFFLNSAFLKNRITEQVNFRHSENINNPKKQSMTTRQMALIHHAAAIPVDGEQWRLRMEMWMEASRPEPLSDIIRGLDDMRIDYDLSRCVIYTSPLIPDEDDNFREARA